MAETEVKSINGRTLVDVTARAKIDEIKNAAPGLVFDTVADMEAYIAGNAGTLKVGQDLFIRAADVPDYWWDGTDAVPVETELGEVKEQLNELSEAISEQGKEIPKVFPWAIAELPFDETTVSDYVVNTTGQNPGGFVTNPVGFEDGKPYFQYHAGAKSFTWTNPNPQKGAVTITAKGIDQYYSNSGSARLRTYYDDGTEGDSLYIVVNHESRTVTWTSDPEKTLAKITGNYDLEGYVLLDMDVMSIVADYPAPTGTVKSVNGNLPDENGNVEIDIPESGGSGGTDIALGISGATVGQIARITAVDDTGMPTAWDAVDLPDGGGSGSEEWELLHSGTTDVNVAGFEFDEVSKYSKFLFLGTWVNGVISAGLEIRINGACVLRSGTYFVHKSQEKNVSAEIILMPQKRFSMKATSQQVNNTQYNIDKLCDSSIYNIPETVAETVEKIGFFAIGTTEVPEPVPVGATYALYVRE